MPALTVKPDVTNLRRLRRRRNLSQQQLAEAVGMDNSYLSRIECGHRRPASDIVQRLALALGCDAVTLLQRPRSR
jgi:transcriptional regulator with XRE-family HTH domain